MAAQSSLLENVMGSQPGNVIAIAASNEIVFAAPTEEFDAAIYELDPTLSALKCPRTWEGVTLIMGKL
jgi:hypothetical protein